jgi:thymidylate kinase
VQQGLEPDLTLYFDVDPQAARSTDRIRVIDSNRSIPEIQLQLRDILLTLF